MNAYFAIIATTENTAASSPVLGWAAIDLTVQDTRTSSPTADKAALMAGNTTPADQTTATPHQLTDAEAQAEADRYAGEDRHAVRLNLTDEQWAARPLCGAVLENGQIRQGEPVIIPVLLKDQARSAMQSVMAATQSHGWGIFSPMPEAVSAYGKALSAIISGSNTTSTTLPTTPAELS